MILGLGRFLWELLAKPHDHQTLRGSQQKPDVMCNKSANLVNSHWSQMMKIWNFILNIFSHWSQTCSGYLSSLVKSRDTHTCHVKREDKMLFYTQNEKWNVLFNYYLFSNTCMTIFIKVWLTKSFSWVRFCNRFIASSTEE